MGAPSSKEQRAKTAALASSSRTASPVRLPGPALPPAAAGATTHASSSSGVSTVTATLALNYDSNRALSEINTKVQSVINQALRSAGVNAAIRNDITDTKNLRRK